MPKNKADAEATIPAGGMKEPAAAPAEAKTNGSGFYIYIGPNIKGLIQTGTIYRGSRAHALRMAAAAVKAQPKVKSLIVAGDELPQARLKVRTPGNILYANYHKLAGK